MITCTMLYIPFAEHYIVYGGTIVETSCNSQWRTIYKLFYHDLRVYFLAHLWDRPLNPDSSFFSTNDGLMLNLQENGIDYSDGLHGQSV